MAREGVKNGLICVCHVDKETSCRGECEMAVERAKNAFHLANGGIKN